MFDQLYVLARGGHVVFSGRPQHLTTHLRECNIICNRNQVPIEHLITISAKGIEDERVVRLRDKTSNELKEWIKSRINETKEKQIVCKNKGFSIKDIKLLVFRELTELYEYKWRVKALNLTLIVITSCIAIIITSEDIGKYNDCTKLNDSTNSSCTERMDRQYMVGQNIGLASYAIFAFTFLQMALTINEKLIRIKLFDSEHQNSLVDNNCLKII
jgi:hypothetical protein